MLDEKLEECFKTINEAKKVFDLLHYAKSNQIFKTQTVHNYRSIEKLQARLANCILYEIEQLIDFHLDPQGHSLEEKVEHSFFNQNNKSTGRKIDANNPILNQFVKDYEISVRLSNCLQNAGINFFKELIVKNRVDLLKTKNFGLATLKEIEDLLDQNKLRLGMEIVD